MTHDELVTYLRGEFLRGPMGHRAETLASFIEMDDAGRSTEYETWKSTRAAELQAQQDAIAAQLAEIGG